MLGTAAAPALSVIVPIFNEGSVLRRNLCHLLDGLPESAVVVLVCNGSTDDSAAIARAFVDPRIRVIETEHAGKARALRLGEAATDIFPRFFVDADVRIKGSDLERLATALGEPMTEMVSPRIAFEFEGAGLWARAFNRTWSTLPYASDQAFQYVIGVSRSGRARWSELPDILADDSFMALSVPAERRRIVAEVVVSVRLPLTFRSAIGVRSRIAAGLDELERLGLRPPPVPAQRRALLARLTSPRTTFDAAVYLIGVLLGRAEARIRPRSGSWYRDATSRH